MVKSGSSTQDQRTIAALPSMPRVVVHLRRRDLLRAQFQMVRRMPVFKLLFVASLAYGAWILFNSAPPPGILLGALAGVAVSALIVGAAVLMTYAVAATIMLIRLGSTPGVLGEHTFEITEDGLREVTEVSEIRVAWGSAKKVFRTRSFLFALVHARGAFLFPRSAFADRTAYDEFWKALQPLAAK
jgi:hypothetical protein